MATSAIAGYKALLKVSTASGQTEGTAAELRDFTVNYEAAEIDATSHDSSGTREIIMGIDNWSGDGELLHVQASTSHKALFDVMAGKTLCDFEFLPTGSSSDGYYSGSGYVNNYSINAPTEDALGANLSFVGTGVLTRNSSA